MFSKLSIDWLQLWLASLWSSTFKISNCIISEHRTGQLFLGGNLPEVWFLKNESNRGANSINTAFVLCQRPYEHQHKRLKQKRKVFSKLFPISFFDGSSNNQKTLKPSFLRMMPFQIPCLKKHALQSPRKWDMLFFGWKIPWTIMNCTQATLPWAWLAASLQKPGDRVVELLKIPSGPPTCGMPGIPSTHRHTHTLPSMKLHTYTISSSTNTCAGAYTPIGFLW